MHRPTTFKKEKRLRFLERCHSGFEERQKRCGAKSTLACPTKTRCGGGGGGGGGAGGVGGGGVWGGGGGGGGWGGWGGWCVWGGWVLVSQNTSVVPPNGRVAGGGGVQSKKVETEEAGEKEDGRGRRGGAEIRIGLTNQCMGTDLDIP